MKSLKNKLIINDKFIIILKEDNLINVNLVKINQKTIEIIMKNNEKISLNYNKDIINKIFITDENQFKRNNEGYFLLFNINRKD